MNDHVDMTRGIYRRIYAGACKGKRINSVSIAAELLFWRLHCVADDFGTFEADAVFVKSQALPRRSEITAEAIPPFLAELQTANLVALFEHGGEQYGCILDFQTLQPANRNGKRIQRFPSYDGGIRGNPDSSGGIQVNPGECLAPVSVSVSVSGSVPVNPTPPPPAVPPPTTTTAVVVKSPTTRTDVEAILAAYPLKKAFGRAIRNVEIAISDVRAEGNARPVAWLVERVEAYSASWEGKNKPAEATWWFGDKRYNDDPAVWDSKKPPQEKKTKPTIMESHGVKAKSYADQLRDEGMSEEEIAQRVESFKKQIAADKAKKNGVKNAGT